MSQSESESLHTLNSGGSAVQHSGLAGRSDQVLNSDLAGLYLMVSGCALAVYLTRGI